MIEYKGTPLFGEGSSVSHTSEFCAIAGTVLFWLLFLIFSFVIKVQPKKQYKEVQIVLSSTPVVQKTEEAPAPAEAASASASAASAESEPSQTQPIVETPPAPAVKESQKPAPKKVETPKQTAKKTETPKPQPKQNTKSTPVQNSEPVEQVLYQDPMEAFANQTKQQTRKEVDWDAMFDDEPSATSTTSQSQTVQNNAPAFSDIAGTAAATDSQKVTSTSTNTGKKSDTALSSTSKALEGIKNTFKGNATNGVQSETTVKTKESGSGRVEMEMSNGRSRALLSPASPVINLSAQAAATIDTSKTVTINFKVLNAGNVTDIMITPESILASIVRDEIKAQISKWLFEADDYTATATFEYKIVKQ